MRKYPGTAAKLRPRVFGKKATFRSSMHRSVCWRRWKENESVRRPSVDNPLGDRAQANEKRAIGEALW